MNRKILLVTLSMLLLALALAGCGGGSTPPALVVTDNFQSYTANANLPSPWTPYTEYCDASPMIVKADPLGGSQAAYKSSGYCDYYHQDTSAENCTVTARIRWGGAAGGAGYTIFARRTAVDYGYRLSLSVGAGTVYLVRNRGDVQQLDTAVLAVDFDYTAYHEFKLEVNGTSIKGYLDGTEIVSAVNADVTDSGYAGIGTSGGDIYFDDFERAVL